MPSKVCPNCNGTRTHDNNFGYVRCRTCDGKGFAPDLLGDQPRVGTSAWLADLRLAVSKCKKCGVDHDFESGCQVTVFDYLKEE